MDFISLSQNLELKNEVEIEAVQEAAFAYIIITDQEDCYYLLRWNRNWRRYNLIGGKLENCKGDDGNLHKTLRRELSEEIGLNGNDNFGVQELIQVNVRQFSLREERNKNYHFIVYKVDIYSDKQRAKIITDPQNILVTFSEIKALETVTGRPISKTARHILEEIEGTVFEF